MATARTRQEIVAGLQKLVNEFLDEAEEDSKLADEFQNRGLNNGMMTAFIKAEEKRKAAKKLENFISTIRY